jgi:hypothetical protein
LTCSPERSEKKVVWRRAGVGSARGRRLVTSQLMCAGYDLLDETVGSATHDHEAFM